MEGKRAVIYCRVSTNSDSQAESLDKQIMEAIDVTGQLGYELVDRFIDEGKTGTTKETRKEYLRMISQIEEKRFDVIVTKSLDRMNRNILDFYLFLDLIIKNDIKLYFYLDRAYYKAEDKIVIGIKAILAEEYSRELSKKLCNAHAKRQERGQVVMLSSLTYGYRKVIQPDGKRNVVIDDDEARMIQLIFDYCIEGYGTRAISGILYSKGYRNRNGNQIAEGTIRRIIRNPLVMGTMVMNKIKFDFNTKLTIHTDPSDWKWKEDAVPAIISAPDWERANEIMDSRVIHREAIEEGKKSGMYLGKFNLSGKIKCGLCGKPYYRSCRSTKKTRVIQWRCSTYVQLGRKNTGKNKNIAGEGCDGISLDEELLISVLGDLAINHCKVLQDKQSLIGEVMEIFEKIMSEKEDIVNLNELEKKYQIIRKRQDTLLEKYLDGNLGDEIYVQMGEKLHAEISELKQRKAAIKSDCDRIQGVRKRIDKIEKSLEDGGFEQAAACFVLNSIEHIVVYSNQLTVIFNTLTIPGMNLYDNMQDKGEYTIEVPLEPYMNKHLKFGIEQSKKSICEMIVQNPRITIAEMAEKLNIAKRTAFSRIKDLKAEGKIGIRGHGPGTIWYVIEGIPTGHPDNICPSDGRTSCDNV